MKNYNKILEAVNKGIQLALDDFEDNEPNSSLSQKSDVIDSDNVIKNRIYYEKFKNIIKNLYASQITQEDLIDLAWLSDKYGFKHQFLNKIELKTAISYISLVDANADLNWIDVSNIDDMSQLFKKTTLFVKFDISKWDVSHVTNMERMFEDQELFNCNLSHWDVSNVIFMNGMFYNCKSFNWPLDNWDVSNVELMDYMFYYSGMKHDISNWDVSNVKSHQCFASNMFMFPLEYQPKFLN